MATPAEIQTAYKAIYRADLNATVATAIAGSGISLDAYIAQQLPQVATTTQASVAIAAFVTGLTPTSDKLDALTVDAGKQVASYTAMGSANPQLGAFEAFGRAFATDSVTGVTFTTKYGSLSNTDFINVVYAQVYGTQPNAAQLASLQGQIDYFTKLYATNNVPNGATAAKGAVLGQIVGYAFTSSASANSNLDNQVQSMLTSAAKGDTSVYAKALPIVVDPGQLGVTINFTTAADVIGPGVADPALKTTANNDTINGTFTDTNKIDGGAGEDTANLKYGAADITVATGQLVSVETVNLTATAAKFFDVEKATGIKAIGFVDNAAIGVAQGIAAGVNLSVKDTSADTDSFGATFKLKDATGTSDLVNLTVDGLNDKAADGAPLVTINGVETVNLKASGTASTLELADDALKAFSIDAAKDVSVKLTAATTESITVTGSGAVTITGNGNAIKTIDASANIGGVKVADVGDAAVTIKGGSGADTFGDITADKAVVTAGGGNDTITFNLSADTKTGTVTGGAGGDVIDLGAAGKVTAVYANGDSTLSNYDTLKQFDTGKDKIDFKALTLTTAKDALNTYTAAALVDQGDYFGGKAVAYGEVTGAGAGWYLLADTNGNGKFDLATDLAIKINGGAAGSVVFNDLIFV